MATRPVEMSERLLTDSRKAPVKALAEAIWNALDVGADHMKIDFEYTSLEAIQTIIVTDDGAGMNRERAGIGFGEYGDSWKRRIDARTHNGRTVHGQRGQGRYDLLHLGLTARAIAKSPGSVLTCGDATGGAVVKRPALAAALGRARDTSCAPAMAVTAGGRGRTVAAGFQVPRDQRRSDFAMALGEVASCSGAFYVPTSGERLALGRSPLCRGRVGHAVVVREI